jgi:hypothetical protein
MSEETYNAWPENFPDITSLIPYRALRHSGDPEIRELYDRAKNHEDREAATRLINRLVNDVSDEGEETYIEKIRALGARHPNAIITAVHGVEGGGRNKIPQVLAEFIGVHGNLAVDTNIVQADIVGRTGESTWHRLAYRPGFHGEVKPGREYIMVDDVISAGGTLSELRQFIESRGGTVVAAVTLSNGAKSIYNTLLAVTKQHILELENKYGVESLQQFLKEEQLYGGNHKALTDAEARTLLGAASLNEARNRIAAARQKRDLGIRPEVVPGTSPDPETVTAPSSPENEIVQTPSVSGEGGAFPAGDDLLYEAAARKSEEALIAELGLIRTGSGFTDESIQKAFERITEEERELTAMPGDGPRWEKILLDSKKEFLEELVRGQAISIPGQEPALHEAGITTGREKTMADNEDEGLDQAKNREVTTKNLLRFFEDIKKQEKELNAGPGGGLLEEKKVLDEKFAWFQNTVKEQKEKNLFDEKMFLRELKEKNIPAAPYEAEKNIDKEKSMSDEYDDEDLYEDDNYGNEGLDQAADAIADEGISQAADTIGDESLDRAEAALGPEEKQPVSPDEQAFLTVVHQRNQIEESLLNGSLPCLPGADGYADTEAAVNLVNGTHYHGTNLLYLKDFQKRNGFPTAEYATVDAIQKSKIPIRQGEHGVSITFSEKTAGGEWENKSARLFNVAQLARPWEFKKYAEGVRAAKEQEREAFLKSQFGEKNYQPKEKKEREPGPEISCTSTEPDRYLAQYLAAVSLGGKFKVTAQQGNEFAEKIRGQLHETHYAQQLQKEVSDPFKLSKICNTAGNQCKEIIKEVMRPKREQTQNLEQQHTRHM